jgi:hypothetical protein
MANKKAKGKPEVESKNTPRQDRLPGMADAKIQALHNAAMDYADIRDQRQALTKQEVDLKEKLIGLMHAHKKEVYDYNGVHIELIVEEETVKVRVKSPEDAEKSETKAVKKPDKRTEFNPAAMSGTTNT